MKICKTVQCQQFMCMLLISNIPGSISHITALHLCHPIACHWLKPSLKAKAEPGGTKGRVSIAGTEICLLKLIYNYEITDNNDLIFFFFFFKHSIRTYVGYVLQYVHFSCV